MYTAKPITITESVEIQMTIARRFSAIARDQPVRTPCCFVEPASACAATAAASAACAKVVTCG